LRHAPTIVAVPPAPTFAGPVARIVQPATDSQRALCTPAGQACGAGI